MTKNFGGIDYNNLSPELQKMHNLIRARMELKWHEKILVKLKIKKITVDDKKPKKIDQNKEIREMIKKLKK